MKKLLYLNLDFIKYQNKAKAQVKAFSKLNISTQIATIDNNENEYIFKVFEYEDNNFNEIFEKKLINYFNVVQGDNSIFTLFKRYINTKKLYKNFRVEFLEYYKKNNYDYCYIRRIGFFIIYFKKLLKEISKKSKVLYEIPTYPLDKYDNFLLNISQKFEMIIFNLSLKKYISLIPIMIQNDCKKDKKMVPIFNAIDYEKFSKIDTSKPKLDNDINLIIIAHILPWHGYDRLVKSLKEYKGKYNINVYIYSDFNSETLKLKELVKGYSIDNVFFKGEEKLDNILKNINKYNIAIGSLGYHRRNGKYDTSIKNKEYCAMGLPCVCSAIDLAFPKNFDYIYFVEPNDTTFDIEKIIEWYKKIYNKDYKKEMQIYAKNELSFEKNYKNIFKRLEDEK